MRAVNCVHIPCRACLFLTFPSPREKAAPGPRQLVQASPMLASTGAIYLIQTIGFEVTAATWEQDFSVW